MSTSNLMTRKQMAEYLDLSERQIYNLINSGIIPTKRGQKGLEPEACRLSYIRYLRSQQQKAEQPPEKNNYNEQKTRLTKAQADKVELEVSIARKELIPADEVDDYFESMALRVKGKLMGIPSRLAPQLLSQDEPGVIEQLLKSTIVEALEELSNDFRQ